MTIATYKAAGFILAGVMLLTPSLALAANTEDEGLVCDRYASADNDAGRKSVPFEQIDPNMAIPACEAAVRQHPQESRYSLQLARAYFKKRELHKAMKFFLRSSKQGNANAAYDIAVIYAEGEPPYAVNSDTAFSWFRISAERGFAPAQRALGIMYTQGRGVARDEAEAVKWLEKAVEQQDPDASHMLGYSYLVGRGVPKDLAKAFRLIMRAAEHGNAEAQYSVGTMYAKGEGIATDKVAAASWFKRAAEQGHSHAQLEFGKALVFGEGTSKDQAQGLTWIERSAKQDDPYALLALGIMYADGIAFPQDRNKAAEWYRKAIAKGSEEARKELEKLELPNEVATPPVDEVAELRGAYESYVVVKTCYDMRKSYLIQMVDDNDIAVARGLMRKIEDESHLSKEKKDQAWEAAGESGRQLANAMELARTFGASTYTSDINLACRSSLAALRSRVKLEPTTPKRDF